MGPSEVRSTGTTWDPRFINVPYGAWLVLTTLIFHEFQSDFLPQMFNLDGVPKKHQKNGNLPKFKERSRRRRKKEEKKDEEKKKNKMKKKKKKMKKKKKKKKNMEKKKKKKK